MRKKKENGGKRLGNIGKKDQEMFMSLLLGILGVKESGYVTEST